MEFLNTVFYFLILIGVLVFIHELGHFLAAKMFGMRAEVFALGMGNRVLGWNTVNNFTWGKLDESVQLGNNTDYRLSAFPVGGYVKIAGMIDESFDTEFINKSAEPWEFRSKPVWQRIVVISAGVIMNIFLAIAIFWGINYVQGESLMQTTEVGAVMKNSAAEKIGLHAGDKILSINGKKIEHWEIIQSAIYLDNFGKDLSFTIQRANAETTLFASHASLPDMSEAGFGLIPNFTEAIISDVMKNKPAEKAGLKPGDVIISLNATKVFNQEHVIKIVKANPLKPLAIEWKHNGELKSGTVTPSAEGLIGIAIGSRYNGPTLIVKYGLFESLPHGLKQVESMTKLYAENIWQMFTGKVSFTKSVGGPVKIAQAASRTAEVGIVNFLAFMAVLSISLAVINILPFPALDGGHLVILLYEAIFRKPLPQKFQQVVQQIGVALLLGLMVFVLYNDIFG